MDAVSVGVEVSCCFLLSTFCSALIAKSNGQWRAPLLWMCLCVCMYVRLIKNRALFHSKIFVIKTQASQSSFCLSTEMSMYLQCIEDLQNLQFASVENLLALKSYCLALLKRQCKWKNGKKKYYFCTRCGYNSDSSMAVRFLEWERKMLSKRLHNWPRWSRFPIQEIYQDASLF